MALLQVEDVSKRFGAIVVADHVNLSVAPGEALGIIGPNGAGKTSLFNLIAGRYAPDAGKIVFQDRDVTSASMRARCHAGIARTFQIPQPFARMTVFENLLVAATAGAQKSVAQARRDCAELLERTHLSAKANVAAGGLPLLDRKRLELARALATEPKLLLLDEVAGGLTEPECLALVETIQAVRAHGVAIVWIEHVVHALLRVIDRLVVLHFGKLLREGEPNAVMADAEVRQIYMGIAPK
jgi:branched-chain amino acid transport system ATP-binding protein